MISRHMKQITLLLGCIALFGLLASVHLSQGQSSPGYIAFWQQLMNDEQQMNFLLYQRLPRFVIGCIAGAALAIAGMIMQTITKNPLASASTLGIHSGAYFFVVATTIFMPKISGAFPLLVTFSGGLVAALLVWLLVGKTLDPVRVALTGMIVSMLFASLTGALQLFYANEVSGLFLWGSGTLLQLDWSGVQFAWPWVVAFIIGALLISRKLDILLLDEETAIGLGEKVDRNKLIGWFVAIFLVSVTVAVVGPIGFIGIIAPHIVRLIGFHKHFSMIVANMIIGAMLLIMADILVRLVSQTSELPVGAMTALIGGPWLVYLAIQMGANRKASSSSAMLGGHDFFQRKGLAIVVASILAAGTVFVSLLFGGTSFTPITQIFHEMAHNLYVWDFRVPRVLVSFLVGMIMAAGGMIFQAVLRNPLADASVLGVTSGAGMMAMILLIVFPSLPFYFVPAGAIFGALLAMGIILTLTYRSGFQPVMLVLIGVCISAMFSAMIQILIVKAKLHVTQALTWISGSTYGSNWQEVIIALLTIVIFFPIIHYFTRTFNVLVFKDEVAIGLGVPTVKMRLTMIMMGVTLAGISAAIVGTIGFIGLLAPHAARRMVGSKHQYIFPVSVLLGGILLTISDFLGRYLLAPNDIPAGLMVSLVGAPYLLYLLKKAGKVSVR
ncbi:iron ABC transporter permease [Pontibacillus litoralis]|uniref:Iron ABC transporter permease n=1 Tax=Pontibacillus litoralis JSM 072002 TaxID=1385512 RepID=A0A0A5G4T8_9BACI|nr:iron ABC transporter permease [Pontibacillus litoralis]KGX86090.1 iron ABC transporter permease [Pontibacillus litoralis JSM 072002]